MVKRRFSGCLVILCATTLLLVGGYFILKLGYCRNWWGRDSIAMRSLWLCDCASGFEQQLYSPSTTVLFSVCEVNSPLQLHGSTTYGLMIGRNVLTPGIIGSPQGSWVALRFASNTQLINLYDNQKITIAGHVEAWLAEDLAWVIKDKGKNYLFRPSTQAEIPLPTIDAVWPEFIKNQELTSALVPVLKAADSVFVIDFKGYGKSVVVLTHDYWQHPERNFFFDVSLTFRGTDDVDDKIEALLSQHNIAYLTGYSYQSVSSGVSIVSPKKHFEARKDGVYDRVTLEKVLDYNMTPLNLWSDKRAGWANVDFSPCCWRSDEKVLLLAHISEFPGETVRAFTITPSDIGAFGIFFTAPQPVLKVTLPDELFAPVPTPTP